MNYRSLMGGLVLPAALLVASFGLKKLEESSGVFRLPTSTQLTERHIVDRDTDGNPEYATVTICGGGRVSLPVTFKVEPTPEELDWYKVWYRNKYGVNK